MIAIGVDCTFSSNGKVRVSRIKIDDRWHSVSQGRQWLDQEGRHVLVMVDGHEVQEIVLNPNTMAWEMKRGRGTRTLV